MHNIFKSYHVFFVLLFLINPLSFAGMELPRIEHAEAWIRSAEKAETAERKLHCLESALEIYGFRNVNVADFDWQKIVYQVEELHKLDNSLKIRQSVLSHFAFQESDEALNLLERCVTSDLISYVEDDFPMLQALYETIEKELQNHNDIYVGKAVGLAIKAITKGARSSAFTSSSDPMAENEIMRITLRIGNEELLKVLIESKIVSINVLKSAEIQQKLTKCKNQQMVQYCHELLRTLDM